MSKVSVKLYRNPTFKTVFGLALILFLLLVFQLSNVALISPNVSAQKESDVKVRSDFFLNHYSSHKNLFVHVSNEIHHPQYPIVNSSLLTFHDPIIIENDTSFSDQGWPGTGILGDPYRIENLMINVSSSIGIQIRNTRAHFKIHNCVLNPRRIPIWADGIYLENVTNAQITQNYIEYFTSCIHLNHSNQNLLQFNWCMESTRGVLLTESSSNFLSNNTLLYNLNGFNIHYGANNIITWNVVSANQQTTTNYGETNVFDYNFWSDYQWADADENNLGDVPYLIPGTPGIYDFHPLMLLPQGHPPVWRNRIGTNYILEAGTTFAIQLQAAAAPPGTIYWDINTTDYFFILDGTLTVNYTIPVGEYNIQVTATDAYANTISMSFTFFIIDNRPPQWINIPPTVQYWTAGQFLSIQFEAEDPSGIDQWTIDDDEYFTINETGYLTSRDVLEENSTHTLWVSVNDTLGHATGLQFTFIVLPVRPPFYLFVLCLGIIIGAIFIIVLLAGYWLRWKPYL